MAAPPSSDLGADTKKNLENRLARSILAAAYVFSRRAAEFIEPQSYCL